MPKISIIIPTYNHLQDCLKPCIESLERNISFVRPDVQVDVYVIANGCTDGTIEYIKNRSNNYHVIESFEALGYPKAINLGLSAATDSDYVLLLNNDVVLVDRGKDIFIDMLLDVFKHDSNCGIAGCSTLYSKEIRSEFVLFYAAMLSRKVIDVVGLLDIDFSLGGCEDIDYCKRTKDKGFTLHCIPWGQKNFRSNNLAISCAPITHSGEQTVFGIPNWNQIFEKNKEKLAQKYAYLSTIPLNPKKVSIIIPTYNHLQDCLKPCIESIIRNTTLTQDIEVLVVANGCTDGTHEYVMSLNNNFKLLEYTKAVGYPHAINLGISFSTGDYIILLNNDATILDWGKDKWIDMLLEPFLKDKNCGISGPLMNFSLHSNTWFIVFFCAMISRTVVNKLGGLDTDFGPGAGEDTAYCVQTEQAGFNLHQVPLDNQNINRRNIAGGFFPIYHVGGKTVREIPDYNKILERNSELLRKKYFEESKK